MIAVANGAGDLERRPGFIAYGFAVDVFGRRELPGGGGGDGALSSARRRIIMSPELNFRENARPFALPGETDRTFGSVSYSDPGSDDADHPADTGRMVVVAERRVCHRRSRHRRRMERRSARRRS